MVTCSLMPVSLPFEVFSIFFYLYALVFFLSRFIYPSFTHLFPPSGNAPISHTQSYGGKASDTARLRSLLGILASVKPARFWALASCAAGMGAGVVPPAVADFFGMIRLLRLPASECWWTMRRGWVWVLCGFFVIHRSDSEGDPP